MMVVAGRVTVITSDDNSSVLSSDPGHVGAPNLERTQCVDQKDVICISL